MGMNPAGEAMQQFGGGRQAGKTASIEGACREKNWAEMGLEEKVERLHRLCRALIDVNNRMAERLEEAHYASHHHMHDPLGRLGVPPRAGDPYMNYPLNALRVSDHDLR